MQDDKTWQSQLFDLLNNHTYNQCEVDLFELMCSVIERALFAQVDWARNSIFFRDLKVSVYSIYIYPLRSHAVRVYANRYRECCCLT